MIFFKNDISAYNKSQKFGWLDEVCSHMIEKNINPKGYWTKDRVIEESTKYKTKEEFKKEGRKKWTKENCLEVINKCKSPGELKKINNVVYNIYLKNRFNIKSEVYWV